MTRKLDRGERRLVAWWASAMTNPKGGAAVETIEASADYQATMRRYAWCDANPAIVDALMSVRPEEVVVARRAAVEGVCKALRDGRVGEAKEWALDLEAMLLSEGQDL